MSYSADEGWFIETDTGSSSRFGSKWMPEAGPFRTVAEAHAWMTYTNRQKLMYPEVPYRVVWVGKEELK